MPLTPKALATADSRIGRGSRASTFDSTRAFAPLKYSGLTRRSVTAAAMARTVPECVRALCRLPDINRFTPKRALLRN